MKALRPAALVFPYSLVGTPQFARDSGLSAPIQAKEGGETQPCSGVANDLSFPEPASRRRGPRHELEARGLNCRLGRLAACLGLY